MIPETVEKRLLATAPLPVLDSRTKNEALFYFSKNLLIHGDIAFEAMQDIPSEVEYSYLFGTGLVHKTFKMIQESFFSDLKLNSPGAEDIENSLPFGVFENSWGEKGKTDHLCLKHYLIYGILRGLSIKTLGSVAASHIGSPGQTASGSTLS